MLRRSGLAQYGNFMKKRPRPVWYTGVGGSTSTGTLVEMNCLRCSHGSDDFYFNDDQSECIVHERYRDSEALIEHTAHLGDVGEAILATCSVSGELLGEPSVELRAKLADSGVRLFTPYQSM